jgi:hypothetical protein
MCARAPATLALPAEIVDDRRPPMTNLSSASLGKLLVDTGIVAKAALEEVLALQRTDKRRLGELLVERGLVRPQQLAQVLSQQLSCPWVALQRIEIAPAVLSALPREVAIAHQVVPVYVRAVRANKTLYVATADPTDAVMLDECSRAAKMTVKPCVALISDVREAMTRLYNLPPERPPLPSRHSASVPPPSSGERVDDVEVVELVDTTPAELQRASILVLTAPERFLAQCKAAADVLGANVVEGTVGEAAERVAQHKPCAIVVTEDVYAFDRNGLNKTALENDAALVVWTEDAESKQLEPLLDSAVKRWRRAAYEKGAVVDGRYELLRDLGGPFATSRWEVRHTKTGRRSILHVAAGDKRREDDAAGVKRQQQALARVSHPGALDLRDAGTTGRGDPYVVVETLEGKTLEGFLASRGRIPIEQAGSIVLQVANVLAAAHAAGVVHGDVRPENVVLTRDGYGVERAKLVGWQMARVVEGTADGKADAAALAACAFTAIVGHAPRPGDKVTGDLPGVVVSLLERAIGAGFESATALATAVEEALPHANEPSALLEVARRTSLAPGNDASDEMEQRRYPRAPYRTPVRVEVPGVGAVDCRSEDISAHGLFVVTRAPLKVGAEVTLRFALPLDGKVVAEKAVVKWSRGTRVGENAETHAVGLHMADPAAETFRQVHKYVSLMSEEAAGT